MLIGALALLLAPAAYAAFATPGQFEVTPTGTVSYTIPIAVPPGTAGMVPSMAISYNSQGGDGLLGMGWSLTGLSAITRCPKTQVQDGGHSSVSYTNADKYCLDGQRLVVSNGGAYGANGTEYRTERDGYNKIISYGAIGATGAAWFKAWTKSGQVIEFGNTLDSAIEAQGKTAIMVWAVNKLADTKGNYLAVTYTEDTPNGQYYPQRIDYTGNANVTPALAPYNSVCFVYADRPDIIPMYDNGSLIKNTKRLTNVRTYLNGAASCTGTMVKDYQLTYDVSAATQRSRITSVKECDGATPATCLQPTTFVLSDGSQSVVFNSFTGLNTTALQLSNNTMGFHLGDFNGDGKTDILRWSDTVTNNAVFLSNGDGSFTQATAFNQAGTSLQHSNNTIGIVLSDFNGDGKTDMLRWGVTAANNAVFLSNGDGSFTQAPAFNQTGTSLQLSNNTIGFQLGDFNGDGKTDILRRGDAATNNAVFLSNGDGSFTQATAFNLTGTTLQLSNNTIGFQLGDFNGDGKTDILRRGDIATNNTVYLSNGNGSFTQATAFNLTGTSLQLSNNTIGFQLGDFNGDGRTDILRWGSAAANNAVFLSNGNGGFTQATTFNLAGTSLQLSNNTIGFQLADFNGDGKTDILRWGDSAANNAVYLSKGDGSFTQATAFNQTGTGLQHSNNTIGFQLGDFNGDGRTDILRWGNTYTNNTLFATAAPFPDQLSTITNGLGATTTISYKPLTDATVYTKDTTGVYPVLDIQVPLYVVSSVASSNGIGGNYTSNYSYAGAKAHVTGGGFMGFRQTTSVDTQTGITSTATYRQDYPYQGLPLTAEKRTSAGTLLSQVVNSWNFATNPAWGAQYHVPQLSQSVESSYELTGALISTVTTCNTYDSYGNPTYIGVWTANISCAAPPAKTGLYVKETVNSYTNDLVNWYLGRLTSANVTSTTP